MAITFFASRTLARNAAKELNNGKVKDMGSTAPAGERWAVEYTSKSDAIKLMAAEAATVVTDHAMVIAEAGDLSGIPTVSVDALLEIVDISENCTSRPARELLAERRGSVVVLDDISDCISTDKLHELVKEAEEIKRQAINVDMSNMYGKPVIMRTRKNNSPVEVRVKRSKSKLVNSALMEALSRVN